MKNFEAAQRVVIGVVNTHAEGLGMDVDKIVAEVRARDPGLLADMSDAEQRALIELTLERERVAPGELGWMRLAHKTKAIAEERREDEEWVTLCAGRHPEVREGWTATTVMEQVLNEWLDANPSHKLQAWPGTERQIWRGLLSFQDLEIDYEFALHTWRALKAARKSEPSDPIDFAPVQRAVECGIEELRSARPASGDDWNFGELFDHLKARHTDVMRGVGPYDVEALFYVIEAGRNVPGGPGAADRYLDEVMRSNQGKYWDRWMDNEANAEIGLSDARLRHLMNLTKRR